MDIVLHLGAHKTATTYLQHRLRDNREMLSEGGVAFAGPPEVRAGLGGDDAGIWSRLRRGRGRKPGDVLARLAFRAEAHGAERLVISEENLIGHLDALLLGEWCYARAAERLADALEGIAGAPLTVALAVRDYADFLPTAYAQTLKTSRFVPFDDVLCQQLSGLQQGWPDVVAAIRSVIPRGARVVLWQYEELANCEMPVFRTLVGDALASELEPLHQRPMPGPTARAIQRLHQINRTEGPPGPQRVRKVLRFNSRGKGLAPFDPWSERERAMLARRYRADLARIAASEPRAFLHPVSGSDPVQSGVSM